MLIKKRISLFDRVLYGLTYRKILNGVFPRRYFLLHSQKLPLQYSLGIIAIDDYEKLKSTFKPVDIEKLTKTVISLITEGEKDSPVYHYTKDKFIIVFRSKNKEENFQRLEQLKRNISAHDFPVKITVSSGIADKKRSDGDVRGVFARAIRNMKLPISLT